MKRILTSIATVLTLALTATVAIGMGDTPPSASESADRANLAAQQDVKARATQSVPVPKITNFQARKNIAEFMRRQDEAGKVWYVYERAPMTGEILGYYTSSSYPQSVCTFMTPPEEVKVHTDMDGDSMVTKSAMALDGVYYKGGDCPDFFFDYNTGAVVVLDSDALSIAVDQPLDIDAPSFSFAAPADE